MYKIFSPVILLLSVVILNAQNEKPEREAFQLKIAVDSVNYYGQEVQKSPYFVKAGMLQIYPSEKIFVETEVKSDSIFSMHVVKENLNPEKTIVIDFTQTVEGREHKRMKLAVKNPFDKTLTYNAFMYIKGRNEWIPTSIIPIHPKLLNYELWNDIILSLVLVDWKIENK